MIEIEEYIDDGIVNGYTLDQDAPHQFSTILTLNPGNEHDSSRSNQATWKWLG